MGVFRRTAAGSILAVALTLAATGAAQAAWSPADSLTSGRLEAAPTADGFRVELWLPE